MSEWFHKMRSSLHSALETPCWSNTSECIANRGYLDDEHCHADAQTVRKQKSPLPKTVGEAVFNSGAEKEVGNHTMTAVVVFCGFLGLAAVVSADPEKGARSDVTRAKRQNVAVFLCGTYPNQYYSYYRKLLFLKFQRTLAPCPGTNVPMAAINSTWAAQAARSAHRGTPTASRPALAACTVPPVPPPVNPPNDVFGFCYDGQLSNIRCSAVGQCGAGQTCMNGLCCSRTTDQYKYACGGQLALGSCTNGGCDRGYVCTSSNYCCECPVGINGGSCRNGQVCPVGYTCSANGICCASCPGNRTPFGACHSGGVCGGGRRCMPGNLCC
ncbi:hypothetical protein L596_004433 [Steinernema carpocapsae]|uniref:Uncharacterized protein n=1 Tax=Steinernema carpocapsae TaxID=34508 RepID=A0A4U8UVQ8_STECR|nr:hypothetical protein L596_004433 [Steinernema carpocapsae]